MSANREQKRREMSDADLVAAAKSGELHAFGELVERSQGLARAVAYSASGDEASVEDLVQEALVTAWTRLSDLTDPTAFRPWLAGIVRNTVRYWRRHQKRHAPRAQAGMDTLATLASAAPSPLDEAQWQQDWQHTSRALQTLSAKYREPLVLYYSLGESHAHVAEALGLSEAAARQRVHRARKQLACEVSSVERNGRRLAARASAVAGILLVIQHREAWAATSLSTPSAFPSAAASASPKLFLAAGALGGAAMVACIVGFVMLVSGESESLGSPNAELHANTPVKTDVTPDEAQRPKTAHDGPAAVSEPAATPPPMSGLVSIGRGNVGDRTKSGRTRFDGTAPASFHTSLRTPDSPSFPKSTKRNQHQDVHTSGRIEKHGPAVLHDEDDKPLMLPDIDMQAVRREFWQ